MPYTLWREVLNGFPGVMFKPVGQSFMLATICLSEEEQAVLRYSAAVGDEMAQTMVDTAAPGVSEADVYAAGMAAAFRRGCQASTRVAIAIGDADPDIEAAAEIASASLIQAAFIRQRIRRTSAYPSVQRPMSSVRARAPSRKRPPVNVLSTSNTGALPR